VQGFFLPKINPFPSLAASAHFPRFSALNFLSRQSGETAGQPSTNPWQANQRTGRWSDVASIPVTG